MTPCPNCGGQHFGMTNAAPCPFIAAPCVECGAPTVLACSDCAIESGGRDRVHVCDRRECRYQHEAAHRDNPLVFHP